MSQLTRRNYLLLLGAIGTKGGLASGPMIPTDVEELNRFAFVYNKYVARLQNDVIDTQLWSEVRKQWERLTH